MTTTNEHTDHAAAARWTRVEDMLHTAEHLITVIVTTDAEHAVLARAGRGWAAGLAAIGDGARHPGADQERRVLGYFLALQALSQAPEALTQAVQELQTQLLAVLLPGVAARLHDRDTERP